MNFEEADILTFWGSWGAVGVPGEMFAQAKDRIKGSLIKIWGPEASESRKG